MGRKSAFCEFSGPAHVPESSRILSAAVSWASRGLAGVCISRSLRFRYSGSSIALTSAAARCTATALPICLVTSVTLPTNS